MSSKAKNEARIKGKGWFVNECGFLYVQGTVDGKFYRKSTRMEHTPRNEAYIRKNSRDVLLNIVNKDKAVVSSNFEAFGRSVVESGAKNRSEHNQKDVLSKFERFLVPFFKQYDLTEIKALHVEAFQEQMLKKYSTSTVSKCKVLLRQIMHKACANDMILKNPVDYAEKIDVQHEKQEAYSIEDAKRMMSESTGWIHAYVNLAFTTGMRTGELMGLMWEDIDFEYSCIYLQRSVSNGRMKIGNAGKKNHKRIVPVLPKVLDILRKRKEEVHSKFVFPNRKGTYYRESKSIVKAHFKPLLESLEIEYITLYATRHTFATITANMMINSDTIDGMVGNSEEVRNNHYVTFEMTRQRADKAHADLAPVNNLFFEDKKTEVK